MSLNTQNLQPIINFIWTVADDVLINKFLENQYQDVILPMTVLRRLDLALEPTKDKVLKTNDNVDVSFYEWELFDAKLGKFITYNVIIDIIKK